MTDTTLPLDVVSVFTDADGNAGNLLGVFLHGVGLSATGRQRLARRLAFSESVFVDDLPSGRLRIHTPVRELPLAGHPLVGTAWLMRQRGHPIAALNPPAGTVPVRFEDGLTWIRALPEWAPPWQIRQLGSPADVDALDGPPDDLGHVLVWAWSNEDAGRVRARVFATDMDVAEDEATGSAAMVLTARLGRPITIRQGRGSVISCRPASDGWVDVGGRVRLVETRTIPFSEPVDRRDWTPAHSRRGDET